jgi:hypothetical protein
LAAAFSPLSGEPRVFVTPDNLPPSFLKRLVEPASKTGIGLNGLGTGRLTAFVKNTTMVLVEGGAFFRFN